ncbi:MAG: DsbA family protein [Ferruginibacter sp.]
MQQPILIYCYDAYCGWCYGFSPVISKIATTFSDILSTDVLSGGMILPEKPVHIGATAGYILNAYKTVEETTGVTFGADYLWHVQNPDDSDWYPHSEKPAIAMCIFKELYPDRAIEFSADLQYALHFEGRDLTDDEAYQHLLEKYSIQPELFYNKLCSDEYKEMAYYEFSLMKQLQVTGYPTVFIQTGTLKFNMVARGYTDYENLKDRIEKVLEEYESAHQISEEF